MSDDNVRIAVLWRPGRNVEMQRAYLERDIPDDALEEAGLLCDGLREAGYDAYLLEWRPHDLAGLLREMERNRTGLVFNASSVREVCFLEAAGIPYCGSGPGLVSADKSIRKMILAHHGVRTAPFTVVSSVEEILDGWEPAPPLKYPLFVKPVEGRGSSGVSDDSIVRDLPSLVRQVDRIVRSLGQAALVENYLAGREVTVGIAGDPPLDLPPLEIEYNGARTNTYEHKMDREIMHCPARLSAAAAAEVAATAKAAFRALGARDYGRVDMIVDAGGTATVLELNTFAGLHILTGNEANLHASYMGVMARAGGFSRADLLGAIARSALMRYDGRGGSPALVAVAACEPEQGDFP